MRRLAFLGLDLCLCLSSAFADEVTRYVLSCQSGPRVSAELIDRLRESEGVRVERAPFHRISLPKGGEGFVRYGKGFSGATMKLELTVDGITASMLVFEGSPDRKTLTLHDAETSLEQRGKRLSELLLEVSTRLNPEAKTVEGDLSWKNFQLLASSLAGREIKDPREQQRYVQEALAAKDWARLSAAINATPTGQSLMRFGFSPTPDSLRLLNATGNEPEKGPQLSVAWKKID